MNSSSLNVSIFVGDIFGGACDDPQYAAAVEQFNTFAAPLVYTPGDNEWTDCHATNGTYQDPIERLASIRKTMFPTTASFGHRTINLEQQRPDYPENGRWHIDSVLFVTINVAGSNNNHIPNPEVPENDTTRGPVERRAAEAEYVARDHADRAWLHESFQIARRERAPAVVLAMQADPGFAVAPGLRPSQRVDGFDRLLTTLVAESKAFAKPVLLVHGDTHRFVNDHPLIDPATSQAVPNFIRVETFGSPIVGWVEIVLDPVSVATPVVEPHIVRDR